MRAFFLRIRSEPWPWLFVIVALVLRSWNLDWGLPELYEEARPFNRAWDMWGWGPARSVDLNPHFFNYPSLTMYLQMVAQALVYAWALLADNVSDTADFVMLFLEDPTVLYVAGRFINVLMGSLTVLVTILIGKRLAGNIAGYSAGALLAVNAYHLGRSQMIEVDIPLTFFVVLSLWGALRLLDPSQLKQTPLKRYLFAGIAIGLAASCKYTGVLLLLPLGVVHLFARRAWPRSEFLLLAAVGATAVTFFLTSPYVVLDYQEFLTDFRSESIHMARGHFGDEAGSTWQYYLTILGRRILGWPTLLAAVAGIALGIWRRDRVTIVLASFLLVYVGGVSTWSMRADRYLLPALPLMLLFAGALISYGRVFAHARKLNPHVVIVSGIAMIFLFTLFPMASFKYHTRHWKPNPRSEAKAWIETNIPSGALLAMEAYEPPLFTTLTLWKQAPAISKRIASSSLIERMYGHLPIPMFQVDAERSAIFYDINLYREVDGVVTSSSVRDRYLHDPVRFATQIAFYDSLETSFRKVSVFGEPGTGPVLTLYQNPTHQRVFSHREAGDIPALQHTSKQISGLEESFYYNLGLSYESYAMLPAAMHSYEYALGYSNRTRAKHYRIVTAIARILLKTNRNDEALMFLREEESLSTRPGNRNKLRSLIATVERIRSSR